MLAFLVLILFRAPALPAQSPQWVDLGNFEFEITYPSVTLNTGDTVTYEFRLGTSTNPADSVLGIDWEVTLSDDAVLPASFDMYFNGSFVFDDSNVDSETSVDASKRKLVMYAERTDANSRSGHGTVLKLTLESASDGVTPDELLASPGGGLVLVENVDMKRAAPPAYPVRVFPNPATHCIRVETGERQDLKLEVYDPRGRLVGAKATRGTIHPMWDTTHWRRGAYMLRVTDAKGRVTIRRFVLN